MLEIFDDHARFYLISGEGRHGPIEEAIEENGILLLLYILYLSSNSLCRITCGRATGSRRFREIEKIALSPPRIGYLLDETCRLLWYRESFPHFFGRLWLKKKKSDCGGAFPIFFHQGSKSGGLVGFLAASLLY